MPAQTEPRRQENLALIFQEVITAIERLRGSRQGVADAQSFRQHTQDALRAAATQAMAAAYAGEDVRLATFVTVAFLDESVLNSQNPIFADWLRKPLQEELFKTHLAGEKVFEHLDEILARPDSTDLADLLEVHYLCLLLGFRGKYRVGNQGELGQKMAVIAEKIRRIRGPAGQLSPVWALPQDNVREMRDPWVKRLGIIAVSALVLMVLLFVVYKVSLGSGFSEVQAMGQGKV
jgi:type VI secretion system protein ImpK